MARLLHIAARTFVHLPKTVCTFNNSSIIVSPLTTSSTKTATRDSLVVSGKITVLKVEVLVSRIGLLVIYNLIQGEDVVQTVPKAPRKLSSTSCYPRKFQPSMSLHELKERYQTLTIGERHSDRLTIAGITTIM